MMQDDSLLQQFILSCTSCNRGEEDTEAAPPNYKDAPPDCKTGHGKMERVLNHLAHGEVKIALKANLSQLNT